MIIDLKDERPIFIQIADGIEDAILSGIFTEESQIPSITEFSVNYKINPATALKGINILVDSGMVYKKRGLGMFVTKGAVEKLREKRKEQFFDNYINNLIAEANRLNISKSEIVLMIERGLSNE
ncbi:GntR family transcriptional regulator [Alkalibaculum sp. M08DMB]|uniref:GntR family transcriptional regulator n=1 Tax=Alkalibaculum sporogenes TaxID=2655001 RepID=A0A6A7K9M7_9FIRM|nr:GntR family transcriptional regulator [Alkalibaculum sporogenes]MPW26160.1 GntR family transcriptional regulator [Alkalibaculum sporogenes]